MSSFTSEIEAASKAALPKLKAQWEDAMTALEGAGQEAADLGRAYSARLATYLALAQRGEIASDIAEMAIERELAALHEVAGGLKEAAAQEAAKRAHAILEIAAEVGLTLVKAAVAAAV